VIKTELITTIISHVNIVSKICQLNHPGILLLERCAGQKALGVHTCSMHDHDRASSILALSFVPDMVHLQFEAILGRDVKNLP